MLYSSPLKFFAVSWSPLLGASFVLESNVVCVSFPVSAFVPSVVTGIGNVQVVGVIPFPLSLSVIVRPLGFFVLM